MSAFTEPPESFPYRPPTEDVKGQYKHIFMINGALPGRLLKTIFDKLVAIFFLIISLPIFILLKLAFILEGIIIPDNKGPMFFYYYAVSAGQVIPKYKIRLIKRRFIDPVGASKHEWKAFSAEWYPNSRTYVGQFVKKFYLILIMKTIK